MNCIDHPYPPHRIFHPFLPGRWILPLAIIVVFTSFFPGTASTAQAGPSFSIPGLNTLQQKFQKKRRRSQKKQRDKRERAASTEAEKWQTNPPPPPPVRNPRYVEMEKLLKSLRIIEPHGLKKAPKAEYILRAKTARKTGSAVAGKKPHQNQVSRQSKGEKTPITPTKWTRPQSAPLNRARNEPAIENQAPKQFTPDQKALEQEGPEQKALQKLTLTLPPLPVRKPRPHPSQVVEKDWSAAVIENAVAQCATLGIKITPMPAVKKGLCGNPAPILLPVIGIATVRPAATLSCPMAANLNLWFTQSVQPLAHKLFGKKIQQIGNVSSYVCRNRYGDTTTRISEHAYANALDIAHFELQGGEKISVLKDWNADENGTETEPNPKTLFLHAIHKSACQYFGTVLGPDANAAHKDHFHLDNAPRKHSNYCR